MEIIHKAQRPLHESGKLGCVDEIGAAVFRVFAMVMIPVVIFGLIFLVAKSH